MTPAETARNEAAKQAVVLVFAVLGALAMMPLYRRMVEQQAQAFNQDKLDPALVSIEKMRGHLEAAKRWDRAASVLFLFGTQRAFWWAHDKAEQARAAYEAERP